MSKQFHVEPGFIVRVGGRWHDETVPLFVEEDEQAEIYVANRGSAGSCLGIYGHAHLNQYAPPLGLRVYPRHEARAAHVAAAGQATLWMPSWVVAWTACHPVS